MTPDESPIMTRTAVCLCVRHEDITACLVRLKRMVDDVRATPWASNFDFHILSDSSRPEIAVAEDAAFVAFKAQYPDANFLHYPPARAERRL